MKHGSLFSGIGGFDLAAEWMGWENVFHCEWNDFGKRVLKYYWPNAISYDDITKTDFTIHRGHIDILTGGFPCQPYSAAGKRLGTEDNRHLWPEMLRAIREIQPGYIVGENVRGLTNWNGGLVFDQVQADLENEGFEVTPFLLPACAVNAPHRRDRIWVVAYSSGNGHQRRGFGKNRQAERAGPGIKEEWKWIWNDAERNEQEGTASNTISIRQSGSRWSEYTIRSEAGPGWKTNNVINVGGWPVESPVCSGNDGLPGELDGITFSDFSKESHAGYGNAIAPKLAYQIFKAIEQTISQ